MPLFLYGSGESWVWGCFVNEAQDQLCLSSHGACLRVSLCKMKAGGSPESLGTFASSTGGGIRDQPAGDGVEEVQWDNTGKLWTQLV